MNKRRRQYLGIVVAILSYYFIHEGAHFLYAILSGSFRQINFMGIGVQIDVYRDRMTDTQIGIFCIAGAVATLICGWILCLFATRICQMKSQVLRACFYYVTLVMLFLDPIYLGVLCGLFGGGDMNGIKMLMPEWMARTGFIAIVFLHLYIFCRKVLPKYQESFQENMKNES